MTDGVKVEQLDEWRFRIPATGPMRVDGIVYASEEMMRDIRADKACQQVQNVAHLPGIVGASLAMPDVHWGYGFPIGGVAAFDPDEGVISPGGVGYDINCGVRLLASDVEADAVRPKMRELATALFHAIPSGVGQGSELKLTDKDLDAVLTEGAAWAVRTGRGRAADLEVTEERGRMAGADPTLVSERARARGRPQLGSLGSGNHFCELGVVDEIYDEEAAATFGLVRGHVTVMIHSGSRGFGYQVCDESLKKMLRASERHGIRLPDRQLCAAPLGSDEAKRYFAEMACAINFAFANRQVMTQVVRDALARVLSEPAHTLGLDLVWDVCHNIAKWERHEVDGETRRLCVHRKGATRAFPSGHPDLPKRYRDSGQPVIIPGDMGRYSYVLKGGQSAMKETFGSSCHGAGRRLSRRKAKEAARGRRIFEELAAAGVVVMSERKSTVAEEIPEAYKDVADVVDVVHGAGLATRVARLRPLAVVKG